MGGQGGCDRRIEVFGKIQKKNGGGGGGSGRGVVRVDVNDELKFLWELKNSKKTFGRVGLVGAGQGGCERRIEVFGKIQKKKLVGGGGGRGRVVGVETGGGGGGQSGCERCIEVFVKIQKKICGGWSGGSGG